MNSIVETPINERINHLFHAQTGIDLDQLLLPITSDQPSGESLRENGIYQAIKKAREADDPNLPLGDWQHDLKVADWDKVSSIAIKALTHKTKDLQIAIWFLEAQVHKFGFAGIAPALQFISDLTDKFWDDIHPQMYDGDLEYRTNLIVWLNEKIQPSIKQLPITEIRNDIQYCWADWELAIQIEQLPAERRKDDFDYPASQNIIHAIIATPIEFYQQLYENISDAISCIDHFSNSLEKHCGRDSPTLSGLKISLLEIRNTLAEQVKHRGLFANATEQNKPDKVQSGSNATKSEGGGNDNNDRFNDPTILNTREQAYRQLSEAAEYLMRDDPHSPVPYLVFKAIDWGNLNTAELYQELFVDYQGQLNIFELLGLDIDKK